MLQTPISHCSPCSPGRTCPVPPGVAAAARRAMRATPTAAPRLALSADDARARSINLRIRVHSENAAMYELLVAEQSLHESLH
jgi:hypothetical protein